MIRLRPVIFFLAAGLAVFTASAQTPPAMLMPPAPQSPVKLFRELLTLSPVEQNNALTNRSPEARARILGAWKLDRLSHGP